MDDRGRLAQPLKRAKTPLSAPDNRTRKSRQASSERHSRPPKIARRARSGRLHDFFRAIFLVEVPRGIGAAATLLIILASFSYGVVRGGHGSAILTQLADTRDALASATGFRIASVAIAGEKEINRDE